MTDARIIKKYANRRLYDSLTKKHLTVDDIRQLLVDGETIKVVDGKTGDDITRQILIQIIADQEQSGSPLLSTEMMHQLVRFYGNSMHDFMRSYLESSVATFVDQQDLLKNKAERLLKSTPMATMAEITSRNLKLWESFQKQMFSAPDPDDDEADR